MSAAAVPLSATSTRTAFPCRVADIDVGGYTWAAQGFNFASQAERLKLATYVEGSLNQARDMITLANSGARMPSSVLDGLLKGMSEEDFLDQAEQLQEMLDQIQAGEAVSAYDLSQVGRVAGQGGKAAAWIGKWAMLGSDWQGMIAL